MKTKQLFLSLVAAVTIIACENEPLDNGLSNTGTSCEQAILNTADAGLNFLSANVDNYTQLCIAYRNALEVQIDVCGDEDGSLQAAVEALGDCNDEEQAIDVEGDWLLTAWIIESPIDLNNDGTASNNLLDEMDCYNNETLVFNPDGTAVSTTNSYADITVEIEIGTTDSYDYIVDCIEETEVSQGLWSQNGNIVTLTDELTNDTVDLTLNGNELSFVVPGGFFALSEDASITVVEDLIFVYTKQ